MQLILISSSIMYHSWGFHCCNIDVEKTWNSPPLMYQEFRTGNQWVFPLFFLFTGGYDVLWCQGADVFCWCWINIGWWLLTSGTGGRKPELGVFIFPLPHGEPVGATNQCSHPHDNEGGGMSICIGQKNWFQVDFFDYMMIKVTLSMWWTQDLTWFTLW
jgi:hypothetical protein